MANRVFLVQCRSGDPSALDTKEDEVVVAASYILPVLWCSLYTRSDIHTRIEQWDDPFGRLADEQGFVSYPILLTSIERAKQRAIEKRPIFFEHFSSDAEIVYDEWLELLHGLEKPYLRVDTGELWSMGTPEEFDEFLAGCVRVFEENRPEDWAMLTGQTPYLEYNPATQQVTIGANGAYALRGYEWLRPVPWKE